ncbi:MAG: DUF362 domain-containing protein [Candidatus Bathyarchaeia archaeon]
MVGGVVYYLAKPPSPTPQPLGKSLVSIVKGEDVNSMVSEALNLIGGIEHVVMPGDKVLIKPNFTWVGGARHPKGWRCSPQTEVEVAANTTDPEVIEALVRIVKDAGGKVIIGEGSGGCETLDAFTIVGVDAIAEKYGVKTVDLNRDECIKVEVPDPLILSEVWVPKTVREADVIISVPALKAWPLSGITVSLKNMIGTAPGNYYGWSKEMGNIEPGLPHGRLPEPTIDYTIVDLASVNRINLAVVDGLWGNEGTWTKGLKPVKMDVIIAGFDPVAVDSVSAMVMGFDPKKIRHLNLAREKYLGTNLLDEIIVKGRKIEEVRKYFEPPSGLEHIRYVGT